MVFLLSVELKSVPFLLARSAARAERTETQKETETLAKREYFLRFALLCFESICCVVSCWSFGNSCF